MVHKTIVITGASDGIGAAAAKLLHEQGATVIIIGRSPVKTKAVADALGAPYYIADFASLAEVRNLAALLRKNHPNINVLVNNAGGVFGARNLTSDGHEKTMQVNHLAHFLLTTLLLDLLITNKATVINTSSIAHKLFSKLDVEDLDMANEYTPNMAYGNAKLENILFTKELHKRYGTQGLSTAAFHPGNVRSNFGNNSASPLWIIWRTPLKYLFGLISVEKGADTLVWLASTVPGKDWQSGEYYYKRTVGNTSSQANDSALAATLWQKSEAMIQQTTKK